MKNKGSKQGSKQGSSPYLLDRNLTPRIEQYALNHDITDTDEVVDYLRRSYKEYQRRPVAALRQMVVKAVQVVQRKGVAKPELVLQVTSFIGVAILGDSTAGSTCTGQSAASSCASQRDGIARFADGRHGVGAASGAVVAQHQTADPTGGHLRKRSHHGGTVMLDAAQRLSGNTRCS